MTAALATGTTAAYFTDYLARTEAKVLRNAPQVGKNALENAIRRALARAKKGWT